MQGIALSQRFYHEIMRPWLDITTPGLSHAAALMGYGSELLGFDDETSKDHNWGPRVQIILSKADFALHAERIVGDFLAVAPNHFLGEPLGYRSRPHAPAQGLERLGHMAHGVEVLTLEACLQDALGITSVEGLSHQQWLGFSEQRLITFTAGAVFHDDGNRLTQMRQALAYFPKDVWLYRIACQWARIGEEQAFVGRAGQVGDDLGSRIIAARLARDVMRLGFLLEQRYAPYAKWFGTAFATLPIAKSVRPHLDLALREDDWPARGEAMAAAYLALAHRQQADGLLPGVTPVVRSYFDRPFATINVDDLVAATRMQIADPAMAALPIMGALDQVTDLTPVIVDPSAGQRMLAALLGS